MPNKVEDPLWRDTRGARADPMTAGSICRELILNVMDGHIKYDCDTVKLSDEKKRKNGPSAQRGTFAQKRRGDAGGCVTSRPPQPQAAPLAGHGSSLPYSHEIVKLVAGIHGQGPRGSRARE